MASETERPEHGRPTDEHRPDGRWDPWRALRSRPHIRLDLAPEAALLGGAMLVLGPDLAVIAIDPALDRRARRVALAHELVHEERGGGCDATSLPSSLDAVVGRDEAAVVREVARRLVPAAALAVLAARRDELDEPLEAWEVAEAFDVDVPTAEVAMRLLTARPA